MLKTANQHAHAMNRKITTGSYDVGYGKPPVASRYRPGSSGNPSGRPKALGIGTELGLLLHAIGNEQLRVTEGSTRRLVSNVEAQYRELTTKAIKGNLAAARIVFSLVERCLAPESVDRRGYLVMSETDAIKQFGPHWEKHVADSNAAPSAGIGTPPKLSQSKKGHSGNRKGQPKGEGVTCSAIGVFRRVVNERVTVEINGNARTITRLEAILRQLHTMALNNDLAALRLIERTRKKFPSGLPNGDPLFLVFSDNDMRV